MVLQDVFIFSDSIIENIRLNNKKISYEKAVTAAKHVNADTFIKNLKNEYNEEVSERGQTFSTGQRQLLAFARALSYNPPVLVLDEATSSIDTETEHLIQDALLKLTKNRTTIVIAHRLSTIKNADNIIFLHKGRIVETGSHETLIKKQGMYYTLYSLQY
jgi:ATP-binding cassette subfamily B multidrug efflux pump